MAMLSMAIAVPLRLSAGRLTHLHGAMTATVGLLSCAIGAAVVLEFGGVQARLAG